MIAENDGESVGSVNPDVGPDVDLLAAAEVIGGGVNELVVEGVVNGAVVEAIAAPSGSALNDPGDGFGSALGVIALEPNA